MKADKHNDDIELTMNAWQAVLVANACDIAANDWMKGDKAANDSARELLKIRQAIAATLRKRM